MKLLKVGCLSVLVVFILIFAIGFFFGDTSKQVFKKDKEEIKSQQIIDATQFSKINTKKLVEIMGKPQSINPYEWVIPKTGQSVVGDLYVYKNNKYEFIVFNDTVTRLNIYSGTYWGYDESTFEYIKDESILQLFGIKDTNRDMRQTKDTGYLKRYERVTDEIYEVEIVEIQDTTFGFAKITYDSNYY